MNLFFDARYIRTDYHDGISRYTTELGNALAELAPVVFIVSSEEQLTFLPNGARSVKIHPVTSWKEPFTALVLNRFKPDVVATPLQSMGSIGRKFKLILNQQDMTYYRHAKPPSQFGWHVRLAWRLYHLSYWPGRWTLNAADVVATVSETSKKEIEAAHLTKRPIIVVPNAARDLSEYLDSPIKQGSKPPANLVYMGAFTPYKNVETLIQALEYLPDKTLHLLSRIAPDRKAELQELAGKNTTRVIFHNGVSDETYANLLADNAIMVSASKSEGFGLPLAEALQLGIPAVVSDIPPFHEVAADGALYADPESPQDFADKISKFDDKELRDKYVAAGKKHIQTFSWINSAKVLLKAAKNLSS